MKKNRTKHLLRTIRKTGVTFVATAIIAAVSIAIYVGLSVHGRGDFEPGGPLL